MNYHDYNYMKLGKKPKTSFVSGKPRYCQKCGRESHKLSQVTKETKIMNQLYYCEECKEKYDKKAAK